MQKAFIFGAGANGAFLARVAREAGYELVFGDVSQKALNYVLQPGEYKVDVVHLDKPTETITIDNVVKAYLISEDNRFNIAKEIAESDLVFTAVGKDNLDSIIPYLEAGLNLFLTGYSGTKNIILGENLIGAGEIVREKLDVLFQQYPIEAEERIGIANSAIHIMSKRDQKTGRIVSEAYTNEDLIVDKDAFRGNLPNLTMLPYTPFARMERRKLYGHNLLHMALGMSAHRKGIKSVDEAAVDPEIRDFAMAVTYASFLALSKEYGKDDPYYFDAVKLLVHRDIVYKRATSPYLADDVDRLIRNPSSKLKKNDRVIGPALLCLKYGIDVSPIAKLAAMTLQLGDFGTDIWLSGIESTIIGYTGLDSANNKDKELVSRIKKEYENLPISNIVISPQ